MKRLFIFLLLSMLLVSCASSYKIPTEDRTYSKVIDVPGAEQQDLYVKTIMWLTDKIGDPYSTNAYYSKISMNRDMPYSKKPYFYNFTLVNIVGIPDDLKHNFDQFDNIVRGLRFLSKDSKPLYILGFNNNVDIAVKPERLQVEFSVSRSGYTGNYVGSKKYVKEYKEIWNSLLSDLEQQVTMVNFSESEVDNLVETGLRELQNKQYWSAKEHFYKATMARPSRTDILNLYAIALTNINLYSAEKAKKITNERQILGTNLQVSLANRDIYQKALDIFNLVRKLEPENETAINNSELCALALSDMEEQVNQAAESFRLYNVQSYQQFQQNMAKNNQELMDKLSSYAVKYENKNATQNNSKPNKYEKLARQTENIIRQTETVISILNSQDEAAILNLLGEMAQKNNKTKNLSATLNSLGKVAHEYKKIQNATENLDSPSEILNEQNMVTFLNLLGEMAQKNQNDEKLKTTLNSLSKIAQEYENSPNEILNEQNLITVLNSLNEMAQEYQNKQRKAYTP